MAKVKPAVCSCYRGWVCEDHPDQPWEHDGCGAAGELCKNPNCNKDPDSVFVSIHCRIQPGRGKPPIRKTEKELFPLSHELIFQGSTMGDLPIWLKALICLTFGVTALYL